MKLKLLALALISVTVSAFAQNPVVNMLTDQYTGPWQTGTAGTKFQTVATGTAALVSGSVTVAGPFITGSSQLCFSPSSAAITLPMFPAAIVSGTSFTVQSGTATGPFNYLIFNH